MRLLKVTRVRFYLMVMAAATLIGLVLSPMPDSQQAIAHKVEVVGEVGATLHIEPNDTPRAREEVLAWFALTQRGGQVIAEADSRCDLVIYAQPRPSNAAPILTPALTAVDAEGYQDIPGARFAFPKVGAYTLLLSCIPEQAGDFDPFELDFEVTVAAGQAVSAPPSSEADKTEASSPSAAATPAATSPVSKFVWVVGIGGLILLSVLAVSIWQSRQKP